MEFVREMKLYHIQRNKRWGHKDKWSVGTELTVGEIQNKFMASRFTLNYGMPFELNLKEKISNGISDNEISDIELTWREFIIKTREYIFELERAKLDPRLPSRFTCLFLTSGDEIEYWLENLGRTEESTIYELEVTGVIHKANQKFLEPGTYSQKYYHESALKYWKGEEAHSKGSEYLFEGKAKVTDLLYFS